MAGNLQGGMQGAAMGSTFGPYGAIAGGVLGMSGLLGGGADDEAAKQAEANRQAQLEWNRQEDPFSAGGNRAQYVPMLNQYARGGPSSVAQDPTYQAMNAKSNEDLTRRMSVRGQTQSGQEQVALQQNSQNNMMDYWKQMLGVYSSLSGADRGGGSVAKGQDPQNVYAQGMDQQQSNMNNFGGFLGGLKNLFGDTLSSGGGGSIDGMSGGRGSYTADFT